MRRRSSSGAVFVCFSPVADVVPGVLKGRSLPLNKRLTAARAAVFRCSTIDFGSP